MYAFRYFPVYHFVVVLTIAISLINYSADLENIIFITLIVLLGLPHGATDHLLYKNLLNRKLSFSFFLKYLGLMALYIIIWLYIPLMAFSIFLLISIYHFGQSNLFYIDYPGKTIRIMHFFLWGLFVIVAPVLFNPQQSFDIITEIVSTDISFLLNYKMYFTEIVFLTAFLNIALFIYLYLQKKLDVKNFSQEITSIVVLWILFYTTPLLIAFVTYFAFWHALNSIIEQSNFYRSKEKGFTILKYYIKTIPLTLVSLAGILIIFYGFEYFNLEMSFLPLFFIMISVITLPHMILLDSMHNEM